MHKNVEGNNIATGCNMNQSIYLIFYFMHTKRSLKIDNNAYNVPRFLNRKSTLDAKYFKQKHVYHPVFRLNVFMVG